MLEVSDLNAYYGDSHILQGIALSVAAGKRVAVLGRNGAGKSTLFKSIMNAGPRVIGTVNWNGQALGHMAAFRRARMGLALVPEDRRIFSQMTVMENLIVAREAAPKGSKTVNPEDMFNMFPMLSDLRERFGNQLSGGQQQMVAVARGFMACPQLLLLDEPTEGLAPVIVEQMAKSVVAMCESTGASLLLSEQNIWFARHCTDYLYVLDTGRPVFHGDWAAFDADGQVKARYLAV
jgi:branched-chain amino acid transport system ATP-binding protein